MEDRFGHRISYLRVSITDRCNERCTYCMPQELQEWLPRAEILTFEETLRLIRIASELGVTKIRLTGGEPLVRHRLNVLVAKLAALEVDLALTTNGATLAEVAHDLKDAGLERINISLDSLRPDRFLALTRRDALADVLKGIDAALEAGLTPVKVNVVLMRGVNDDEVIDLARFGRDRGVTLRFIEFMPLDADGAWKLDQVVPRDEIVAAIHAVFPLESTGHDDGHGGSQPAEVFRYCDGQGEIGVIASVTSAFCSSCDRIRLTADGQLRACLFAVEETDLRALLRTGASDDDIAAAIERCVAGKWAGHGISEVQFVRPKRSMSQIGG